ncbi:MAG TPA: hypothetical protein VGN12_11395 [Pirellulales bacterium]|jgi:hypothetical protein
MNRKLICLAAGFAALICSGQMTRAGVVLLDSGVGGHAAAGASYVNFDSLSIDNQNVGVAENTAGNGYITATFTPNADTATGTTTSYAAPYLSGDNNLHFGADPNSTYTGPDSTQYLTSGSNDGVPTGASIVLTFSSGSQSYFGMLWGSVDDYNTLTFLNDGQVVTSFTGTQIIASQYYGNQQQNGTVYVNFNSDVPFDEVKIQSSQLAFEFDNVAYSGLTADPQLTIAPEPASVATWGMLGVCIAGWTWQRKKK